jgi:isopenicillin N synthase-like dioxygenase
MSAISSASPILDAAREFFALPPEEKDRVHISRSPHFRGYSVMKNARDWREQIHLGCEEPPGGSGYRQLQGPNLWPDALGPRWRSRLLSFLEEMREVGNRLLRDCGLPVEDRPYLLMKMICYHPGNRPGVAPHCDWSWLTVVHQDDAGGLEQQNEHGDWIEVPDAVSVSYGELAEIATGGSLQAAPHRVLNRSTTRSRISVPVFFCPPLDATVVSRAVPFDEHGEHVHRVRNPADVVSDFCFGESEWRRKGQGRWCWRRDCLD